MGEAKFDFHYNQKDRVREETNWRTRVQKEKDHRATGSGPAVFQLNLVNSYAHGGYVNLKYSHNRMETVTEKEIKQSPAARRSLRGMDPSSLEVHAIKHAERRPTEKWDLPETMSHSAGWLLSNPVRASSLRVPDPSRSWSQPGGRRKDREGQMTETDPTALRMTVTTPANVRVLERVRSEPAMPNAAPLDELRRINSRRWHRPKSQCDVTTYAEAYTTLLRHNPFNTSIAGR